MFVSLLQIYISSNLHGGDDNQVDREGLHPKQIHVPEEPVELARLHRHHLGLRDHRHGGGQPRRSANLPRASRPQDGLHHAGYVAIAIQTQGNLLILPTYNVTRSMVTAHNMCGSFVRVIPQRLELFYRVIGELSSL